MKPELTAFRLVSSDEPYGQPLRVTVALNFASQAPAYLTVGPAL